MKYLLDTNICIYTIKKQPESVISKFTTFKIGELCISTITLAELQHGVAKSKNPIKNATALLQFLTPIDILDFDYYAAREYGIIRVALEQKGTPIGPMDLLIGAHAKSLNLPIVTNNVKEFNRIDGLQVENWVE